MSNINNSENITSVENQRRAVFNTSSKSLAAQILLALDNLKKITQSQKIQLLDSSLYFHFKDDGFTHARNIIGHDNNLLDYSLVDFSRTRISSREVLMSEVENFDIFVKNFKDCDLNNSYLKIINENGLINVRFESFLTN